jgi:hypothetical protein
MLTRLPCPGGSGGGAGGVVVLESSWLSLGSGFLAWTGGAGGGGGGWEVMLETLIDIALS